MIEWSIVRQASIDGLTNRPSALESSPGQWVLIDGERPFPSVLTEPVSAPPGYRPKVMGAWTDGLGEWVWVPEFNPEAVIRETITRMDAPLWRRVADLFGVDPERARALCVWSGCLPGGEDA